MRTKGCKALKHRWHLKIYHPEHNLTLFEGNFSSIQTIADFLGICYHSVWELTDKGRNKRKRNHYKMKFMPKVELINLNEL